MGNNVGLRQNDIVKVLTKVEDVDLPGLISNQVEKLNELNSSVKKAMNAAEGAEESALEASKKSAGFGKKKVAIEELQSASVDLAKAVQLGAKAQKTSFEFQKKLAEISKYLFGLGVSNVTNNRMVVRELEKRLQGASEEEISELAQQELMQVLLQLKGQEDILRKLEYHTSNIQQLKGNLVQQFEYSRQLNERLFEQKYTLEQYTESFEQQSMLNEKILDTLKKQDEINESNNKKQTFQIETNKKFSEKMHTLFSANEFQRNHIEYQLKLNNQHENQIDHIQQGINQIQEINDEVQTRLKQFGEYHTSHEQALHLHQNMYQLLEEKLEDSLKLIEQNDNLIKQLQIENKKLSSIIERKSNAIFTKITLGIGSVGTVLAIIGLII